MPNRVHVLIVEDSAAQAQWFESACGEALPAQDLLVEVADNAETALGLLDRQRVKVWLNNVYEQIDRIGV